MDWEQIEKDLENWLIKPKEGIGTPREYAKILTLWFKQRIENEQPPPPEKLNEEEVPYTTNLTVDNIKANYGN